MIHIFENPIQNIQQAGQFYKSCDCSSFYMAREYQDRYEEYLRLKIPKTQEREWKIEEANRLMECLVNLEDYNDFWKLHCKATDLIESIKGYYEII